MTQQSQSRVEGVDLSQQQDQYMLKQFFMVVVGKPGSGKSYVAAQMIMSQKFYRGKFNTVLVISPSAQKLGIVTKKENIANVYSLEWIYNHIEEINSQQIKKFERALKATHVGKTVPHISQSVIEQSLGKDIKNSKVGARPDRLPPEYISFNKNQRFFSIETLAIMSGGYNANGPIGQDPRSMMMPSDTKKRTMKAIAKGIGVGSTLSKPFGKYEDVDDIEKQLVAKLSPEQQESTRVNIVIVMDDVIGDIKKNESNSKQTQLFFNRRHLIANGCISIILISQKYTMIPSRLRSQASWLILFRLNQIDFENVFKDVILLPQFKWEALLETVFQTNDTEGETKSNKKYDHLDIFVEFDIFFKNFQRLSIK